MSYRADPTWQIEQSRYVTEWLPGETLDDALYRVVTAAQSMRKIELAYEQAEGEVTLR